MKNNQTLHPEAPFEGICDAMRPLEAEGCLCRIIVMSSVCIAELLKAIKSQYVKMATAEEMVNYGYFGMLWGTFIYIDENMPFYAINVYGGDCIELLYDNSEIYMNAKELIDK